MARLGPDFVFEQMQLDAGVRHVAGVDEVGRGPLAGPVAVAAVILDPARIPPGLDDSKALKPARRAALAEVIYESALGVSIALASAAEIDRLNIRGATLAAMRRALAGLNPRPDFALIDGRDIPSALCCPAQAIVGGDARSASIAAASIIAKTLRDALMAAADCIHPGYGFAGHVGYPTYAHREAITRLGLCSLHRRSFNAKPATQRLPPLPGIG
jgi:ribonuclease HII